MSQSRPTILALCLRGEAAFVGDEIEDAVEWYELACAGTMIDDRDGSYAESQKFLAARFARLADLRAMVPWRKVHRLAAPSPGHVLAIMTCLDRNDGHVQDDVLAQFERWRGGARHVFTDGLAGAPIGQARMFFSVLRWAAKQPAFSHLTLLEDDIVLARNALDYIATTKIDSDLAFMSWFSIGTCTVPRTLPVLSCLDAKDYMFNQAITFTAHAVCRMLESAALRNWSEKHGADRIYADVFPDQYVAVHYPNIVQHVGGSESLVGNNGHGLRTSPSFIGEGVNALDLIAHR